MEWEISKLNQNLYYSLLYFRTVRYAGLQRGAGAGVCPLLCSNARFVLNKATFNAEFLNFNFHNFACNIKENIKI
jgi:hypothetical protein